MKNKINELLAEAEKLPRDPAGAQVQLVVHLREAAKHAATVERLQTPPDETAKKPPTPKA